jgi:hypothetical protein
MPSPATSADTLARVSLEREWWLRVLAVLTRPRLVFLAVRVDDEDDLEARKEPVLLIVLLAGIGALVLTPTWHSLYDGALDRGTKLDGLDVALLTFITGSLQGVVGYFVVGGALYLGARAVGSLGTWRLARQVLAFASVPLALSAALLLPVGLGAFGSDLFRKGGSDAGTGGQVFLGCQLAMLAWAAALLVYGVRTTYGWTWLRSLGALALLVVFLAVFALIALVL